MSDAPTTIREVLRAYIGMKRAGLAETPEGRRVWKKVEELAFKKRCDVGKSRTHYRGELIKEHQQIENYGAGC